MALGRRRHLIRGRQVTEESFDLLGTQLSGMAVNTEVTDKPQNQFTIRLLRV